MLVCTLLRIQWCIIFRIWLSCWEFICYFTNPHSTQFTQKHANGMRIMGITWNKTYTIHGPFCHLQANLTLQITRFWSNCIHGQITYDPSYFFSYLLFCYFFTINRFLFQLPAHERDFDHMCTCSKPILGPCQTWVRLTILITPKVVYLHYLRK